MELTTERTLWIAGRWLGETADGLPAWALLGVFETEAAAAAACVERTDFIGPVVLNRALPREVAIWPGARYPVATIEDIVRRDLLEPLRDATTES